MRRIGIIGIENSHTLHFLRHLNTEQRFPDDHGTAILRGEPDRTRELTESYAVTVVEAPEELIGQIDAAIICSRDGALHRQQAEPLLRAGIPVLVDKPLATSAADAVDLVELSGSSGVPLVSASAVRFTPEVDELAATIGADLGDVVAIDVTGPADPASPYSGIFFYGIHTVETALELIGRASPAVTIDLDSVAVLRAGAAIVVTVQVSGIAVTLRFITPDADGNTPFHASVFGRHGNTTSNLTLGPDYNLPLLERFLATVSAPSTGSDVGNAHLVGPIALTERIADLLRTTGESDGSNQTGPNQAGPNQAGPNRMGTDHQ